MTSRTRREGVAGLPARLLVGVAALATAISLATVSSAALYSDSENLAANTFSTATVQLSDDDAGSALFVLSDLGRGDSGSECIVVQYDGDIASTVRLYHQSGSGTLGQHLDITVEEGSGASCGAFSGSTLFDGTLADFASNHNDFTGGLGSFSPATTGETTTFRFTYLIPTDAPSSAASSTVTATLQWEARAT
ncbi:MAG: hypothetical protein ACRBK7_20485 [Acidimicrobiales bacterium]